MQKKRKVIIVLIVVVIFTTTLILWRSFSAREANSKYHTETVVLGDVKQAVAASGTLNPVILVNVGTQVSGTVQKMYADYNDRVKEKQVLLELDPTLFKAALGQSLAQVNKAKANLDLATANETRGLPLYKQNFISKQDWDQLVQARKVAKADLELATATMAKDRANLNYATIYSPVSGIVVNRTIDVGQTVAASFQTPTLFQIAQDLSKMQIDSSFAEADIGNIRAKQVVNFTVDAYPNRNFSGEVKQIRLNPTTQQNVVTYDVVVTVDNKDGVLLPGMTAYVNIVTAEKKNVMLVPNAALRFKPKHERKEKEHVLLKPGFGTVFKLDNAKLTAITGKVGITDNRNTEFTSEKLHVGDQVVVSQTAENATNTTSTFRLRVF
ncbi:MAG: efflux RND transporter periplasmic adaptor subunit [Gammaproteobacteria bacterium]|nr:efflux RND transporter periplasmic adaptor subunit [Gammaproteobacteria bacterium]